jgi:hypothetical protein
MKTASTPQEARAKPGLKKLTPLESALVSKMRAGIKALWTELLSRNKWTHQPPTK